MEDVNKACLPDGNSLIAPNGDFILYRFTGSGMYNNLRQTLHSILETSSQCPVNTPEKATLEWMAKIFNWVESIQNSLYYSNEKLVMKIDHALEILEQGHQTFYTVADEVQLYLREEKVGIHVFPQQFHVSELRGGQYTLGIGLLRWGTLLFECLNSDVDREDLWKERSLGAIDTFTRFDQQSRVGGGATSFKNATMFTDTVKSLIAESSKLMIQDNELFCSLSSLPERMQNNALFRRSIEVERIAMKEKKFLEDKDRFENPRRIVNDRYELLDCLMHKLPPTYKTDDLDKMIGEYDDNSLFPGEQTARDKSRFFLEKSLWSGVETLGLDSKERNIKDFISIFAWNLEEAVHEKYHTDHLEPISSEYRDKIRSLRFNLQDPKVRILSMLYDAILHAKMMLTPSLLVNTKEPNALRQSDSRGYVNRNTNFVL